MNATSRRSTVPETDAAHRAWSAMCELVLDNERRREVSEAVGLSFGRLKALRRIARTPMTMGELAAMLGIDAPYATLVVDDLEGQGLVERGPHPTDRRVKLVTATANGLALAKQAEKIMGKPPAGLSAISTSELEAIAQSLEAALQGVTQSGDDEAPD
jgi:DNA-binding MarR family transcriptional regulator